MMMILSSRPSAMAALTLGYLRWSCDRLTPASLAALRHGWPDMRRQMAARTGSVTPPAFGLVAWLVSMCGTVPHSGTTCNARNRPTDIASRSIAAMMVIGLLCISEWCKVWPQIAPVQAQMPDARGRQRQRQRCAMECNRLGRGDLAMGLPPRYACQRVA